MSIMRPAVVLAPIRVVLMTVGADGGSQVDYGLLAEVASGVNEAISLLSELGIAETAREAERSHCWSAFVRVR
jgi:hypothetical protein